MFLGLSKEVRKKLWPHQDQAVAFAVKHLNENQETCLIRMPTGTGKSGVIACLTRLANERTSLVLTPWANLRTQMIQALSSGFWSEVGLKPVGPVVVEMLPSDAHAVISVGKPQVIVATFTTLNTLRRDFPLQYAALAKVLDLVVVDECHYEPAPEWGQSVKRLEKPTVLLTATPYRNDLKLFRISNPKKSVHHLTHKKAEAREIIRRLDFDTLIASPDIASLASAFAKAWKKAKREKTLSSPTPRAIICCAGARDIERTVAELGKEGLKAIGIHDQFENSASPQLFHLVPDPKSQPAEIWVHQHKLTEGFDDHRFCCIGLFTSIRNDRKLIQQIGRILRHRDNDLPNPALLLAPKEYSAREAWTAYREFETNITLLDPAHFRRVVQVLLKAQPPVEYFERKFRRRFDAAHLEQTAQVIIAPSVLARKTLRNFKLDEYIEECTDTLNTEDAVILGTNRNAPCQRDSTFALWVYASVKNSRLLQSASLYEITLQTHCIVNTGEYVLITDSSGTFPHDYLEQHTYGVGPEGLARFFDQSFHPTHVSVDSAIPYNTVIRGAELHGEDILQIPTSLTDRIQICRSVRGASDQRERRYVGLHNGRLRKEETAIGRQSFEPAVFVKWAEGVARILDSSVAASSVFQRYMQTCPPPDPVIPKTICVDLQRLNLNVTLSDGKTCSIERASSSIEQVSTGNQTSFVCGFDVLTGSAPPERLTLKIDYESKKRRFWFGMHKGPAVHVNLADEPEVHPKNLAEFLNQHQDMVLIGLQGGDTVYQGRHFYRINYDYAERVLLDLIETPAIGTYSTEKGTKAQLKAAKANAATEFPDKSLFRAIADGAIPFPFTDDLLICADLGTECADFVAADFGKRQLALIHAKAGSGAGVSASAFHDIVAQAMKNLVYFTRAADVPAGVNSWVAGRAWNSTGVHRLVKTPSGVPSRRKLWEKIRSDILEDSDPQLYVVLVTTGCCKYAELKEAIEVPSKRTPETAQLLHLLDGLNGYTRQLGVKLRIYDLPYVAPPKTRKKKKTRPTSP